MGSFSIWHFLAAGLQLVVVVGIVGVVVYFLLRQAPATPTTDMKFGSEGEIPHAPAARDRSSAQQVIAITYLAGGLFGAITSLPQLNGVSLSFMSALAWLILLAQIAMAIYGSWQFWNFHPIGAQLLYWLSWSCVPVISFSVISYWCAIGVAFFPTVAIGPGNFSTDFSLRFGYASELWFNNDNVGILLGVNVIAILFVTILTKIMREVGIPKWPLIRSKG